MTRGKHSFESAYLVKLVDGLALNVAIEVEEGGEVLQLLADDEAQGREHGNAAVGDLKAAGGEKGS